MNKKQALKKFRNGETFNATKSHDVGTRAGELSGYFVKGHTLYKLEPARTNPEPYGTTKRKVADAEYIAVRYAADGHHGEHIVGGTSDGDVVARGTLQDVRAAISERIHGQLQDLRWSGQDGDVEAYHDYPEDHPRGCGCGGYAVRRAQ